MRPLAGFCPPICPTPQEGSLPNGEPKRFSAMASMLIYGRQDAVLTDPGRTEDQARVLGDRVAGKGRDCQPSGSRRTIGQQRHVLAVLRAGPRAGGQS